MRKNHGTLLEALTRARPEALDPARLAGSRRQHDDLVRLLSTEPGQVRVNQPVQTRSHRRRVLIPAIGVAVVSAVVVVTLATVHHAPTTEVASGAGSTDGHIVLLNMANSVQNQAQQGAYWESQTQSGTVWVVDNGAKPYVITHSEGQRWSMGVRPGEESLMVTGIDATTGPRSAQDRVQWQAAGSPGVVPIEAGTDIAGKRSAEVRLGTRQESVIRTDYGGDIVAVGAQNVNYAYLQQLPVDVPSLTSLLDKLYTQQSANETTDRTGWMFYQASALITFPVSSAVRASAYRIIAGLPGISSLGKVTDPLGRTGVGVALPAQRLEDLGTGRQELIVDPTTNTILSQQLVLVQPSALASQAGLTAGTVVNYTATTHIGWTDQQVTKSTTTH